MALFKKELLKVHIFQKSARGLSLPRETFFSENASDGPNSVTRLGNLLDFGQLFKAFDNN